MGLLQLIEVKLQPMQMAADKFKNGLVTASVVARRRRRALHLEAPKGFSVTAYHLAVRSPEPVRKTTGRSRRQEESSLQLVSSRSLRGGSERGSMKLLPSGTCEVSRHMQISKENTAVSSELINTERLLKNFVRKQDVKYRSCSKTGTSHRDKN